MLVRARASALILCLAAYAACSSPKTDGPPAPSSFDVTAGDADVVHATALGDAAAGRGVAWWEAHLSSPASVDGANVVADDPSLEGWLAIDFFGHRADGSVAVAGRWVASASQLGALDETSEYEAIVSAFSGSFVSGALPTGQADPSQPIVDLERDALIVSVADSVTRAPDEPGSASGTASLSFQGGPPASCKTPAGKQALKDALAKLVAALETGLAKEPACGACAAPAAGVTGRAAAPTVIGVNGFHPIAELQRIGVSHVRASVDVADSHGCAKFASVDAANAEALQLACVKAVMGGLQTSYLNDYGKARVGITLLLNNQLVPTDFRAIAPAQFPAYTRLFASSAQATAAAFKAYPGPHVYELWNEPDAIAGLSADKLVPLASAAMAAIKQVDPNATFTIGAATFPYYKAILGVPGGLDLLHGLYAYNLHPYNNWPADAQSSAPDIGSSDQPDSYREFPKGGVSLADTLRGLATQVMPIAGTKPITFSEWGFQQDGFRAAEEASYGDTGKNPDPNAKPPLHPDTKRFADEATYAKAFFAFLKNPPADVKPLVESIVAADFYGWPDAKGRFGSKQEAALDKALQAPKATASDACRTCATAQVGALVAGLRKSQVMGDYACCVTLATIPPWMTSLPACKGATGRQPVSDGGVSDGGAPDVVAYDSCAGLADGVYCSQLVSFSAIVCKNGSIVSGQQCAPTTAKCTGPNGPGVTIQCGG